MALRTAEKIILSRLELDARAPFSKFGKKIRKSQQQISYTVNSLIEKNIIQNFYTIIDYSKFNILNFRVYFKVNYISDEKFDELIDYLKKEPHTSWIATCGGRHDLICTFLTLNPSQFNKTLRDVMAKFPKQLQNYIVLTTVVNRQFGRKYLFNDNSMIPEIIFGGDREPEDADGTDMLILNEIAEDARKSSVKIAEILFTTPKTVIQRIAKLREKCIIVGFKPLLNSKEMDYNSTLISIQYHNVSPDLENDLINYLKVHPNVKSIVKTLGMWDLEIEVEVEKMADIRKIEIGLRQKFAVLIQQLESIPLYQTYKKNYFPKFLLEQ